MNLYLSRLILNPLSPGAIRLAADPYKLRCSLLHALPCVPIDKPDIGLRPKTAELLFRIDTGEAGPAVLIQTSAQPDWSRLPLSPRTLRDEPVTKSFAPNFAVGQRLGFRLLAQPTMRKAGQGLKANGKRKTGPRTVCRSDEERFAWLGRKAEANGFRVESAGLTPINWRNSKPLQSEGGATASDDADEMQRHRLKARNLGGVRFDGILVVREPEQLRAAVENGIGTQKAFGFGLLSLARP